MDIISTDQRSAYAAERDATAAQRNRNLTASILLEVARPLRDLASSQRRAGDHAGAAVTQVFLDGLDDAADDVMGLS